MENNLNFEAVASIVGRMGTFMAPSNIDSIEVRIAKEIFRWSSLLAGSAAVGVVVLGEYSCLEEVGRNYFEEEGIDER